MTVTRGLHRDFRRRWTWLAMQSRAMLMFRNSVRAVDLFNIPPENFVEVGRQIEI